jgi:hypothetical protein
VRVRETVGIEHTRCVGHQVAAGVAGASRFVGDRSTGVAVVVADHEPPVVREELTEALLPPQHRRAQTHDEKDRRVGRLAERLGAQLHPVRMDEALSHVLPLSSPARRPGAALETFVFLDEVDALSAS